MTHSDRYVIQFEPFVNEVFLMVTGPRGRLRAELPMQDAKKLLKQLTEAIAVAAEWEPTEGLSGLLE